MIRTVIAAAIVYLYGLPAFNGYRPPFLDKAFLSFHDDVNRVADDTRSGVRSLGDGRATRYFNRYVASLQPHLPGGSNK